MEHQELLFTNHVSEALSELLTGMQANRVFVLTDENTRREVLPRLSENAFVKDAAIITPTTAPEETNTKTGDESKIIIWILVLFLSAEGILIILQKFKKKTR